MSPYKNRNSFNCNWPSDNLDSIFRDLNLNNPSNNLKTLGNQKLTPYNERCFGQQ